MESSHCRVSPFKFPSLSMSSFLPPPLPQLKSHRGSDVSRPSAWKLYLKNKK